MHMCANVRGRMCVCVCVRVCVSVSVCVSMCVYVREYLLFACVRLSQSNATIMIWRGHNDLKAWAS